jgi:hypothetical protein
MTAESADIEHAENGAIRRIIDKSARCTPRAGLEMAEMNWKDVYAAAEDIYNDVVVEREETRDVLSELKRKNPEKRALLEPGRQWMVDLDDSALRAACLGAAMAISLSSG